MWVGTKEEKKRNAELWTWHEREWNKVYNDSSTMTWLASWASSIDVYTAPPVFSDIWLIQEMTAAPPAIWNLIMSPFVLLHTAAVDSWVYIFKNCERVRQLFQRNPGVRRPWEGAKNYRNTAHHIVCLGMNTNVASLPRSHSNMTLSPESEHKWHPVCGTVIHIYNVKVWYCYEESIVIV